MIWISRLSYDGCGVKNVELATALSFSKPSVHNMLKSLCEMGLVRQEAFGLAHFTEEGRILAKKYEICFLFLEQKMREFCGAAGASEAAICGLLADIPDEKINELYEKQKTGSEKTFPA